MALLPIIHPKHGRASVSTEQWNEKAHETGWDEKSARKAGWVLESEAAGKKLADALDGKKEPEAPKP